MAAFIGQDKFFFSVLEMEPQFASGNGAWTFATSGNLTSFNRMPGVAESDVTLHPIPRRFFPLGPIGAIALQKIAVVYNVGTADLSGAPTAVLDQVTINATTRVPTRVAVTQTLAFTGVDTVGVANGTATTGAHAAEVSITTPVVLPQTDTYVLEMTWPCAATSALKIYGFELYFQG